MVDLRTCEQHSLRKTLTERACKQLRYCGVRVHGVRVQGVRVHKKVLLQVLNKETQVDPTNDLDQRLRCNCVLATIRTVC